MLDHLSLSLSHSTWSHPQQQKGLREDRTILECRDRDNNNRGMTLYIISKLNIKVCYINEPIWQYFLEYWKKRELEY